jgi:hypothetical protein
VLVGKHGGAEVAVVKVFAVASLVAGGDVVWTSHTPCEVGRPRQAISEVERHTVNV